ncbi:sugar-transfer associated ATP-grasp domain-containing protein [Azospirillum sp. sgz301742]
MSTLWTRLPYDGQGLVPPADAALAGLRRWAAARFWQRVPWWSRPPLIPLARLAGAAAAAVRTRRFARRRGLSWPVACRVLGDCLCSGAPPLEAFIWRNAFPSPGPHPLPARAAAAVLPRLGNREEHRLLSDKLAAAEVLERAGLPTPPLLAVIPRGAVLDPSAAPWSRPGPLFVKPRHGWAGHGAMAIDVLEGGLYRIDGGSPVDGERLRAAVTAADDVLVQTRLEAAPELADLSETGAAPVLRLATARRPGAAPFLHSALLSIEVPGEKPRNFLRGHVRAPVDPVDGRIAAGLRFLHPERRYERLPWNDAPLTGRALPGFEPAVAMVLHAMALLPGLALVNWDLILTPAGPVILEGNTGGDWILTNLSAACGMAPPPLGPVLRLWAEDHE